MLSEQALKLIQDTAIKSSGLRVVKIDGDPRHVWLDQNGCRQEVPIHAPLRSHVVHELVDLVGFAATCPKPVLWHGAGQVVLVCDDDDRRDVVTCPLTVTRTWRALQRLEESPAGLDQKSLIRLLRLDLGATPDQVEPWRRLDWQTKTTAAGEVRNQRESLGRSIEAEVRAGAALPEDLVIGCSVYQERCVRFEHPVRLLYELDAAAQRITLQPEADELSNVFQATHAQIEEALQELVAERPIPIYFGRP
jgi:hypothetical protein